MVLSAREVGAIVLGAQMRRCKKVRAIMLGTRVVFAMVLGTMLLGVLVSRCEKAPRDHYEGAKETLQEGLVRQ
jgi:hypothetical protein